MNVRFFIVPCMCHLVSIGDILECWVALLLLPPLLMLLLLLVMLTPVLVCGCVAKWYGVGPQYPQNTNGQLKNDQEFCTKLQRELKKPLFKMCTKDPLEGGKTEVFKILMPT